MEAVYTKRGGAPGEEEMRRGLAQEGARESGPEEWVLL